MSRRWNPRGTSGRGTARSARPAGCPTRGARLLASPGSAGTTAAVHDGDAFVLEARLDDISGIDLTLADVPFVVTRRWLR